MPPNVWAILTGEYPPDLGGVADYTRIVAEALVETGDEVHVWTPSTASAPPPYRGGVCVHPLPDRYSPKSLLRLQREISLLPQRHRLLLQYTPNAFGMLGTNYLFALWLAAQRVRPSIMFHELYMPLTRNQPTKYNALAVAQRIMLALLMQSAERAFVSIPTWGKQLESYGDGQSIQWLPIFSNIGREFDLNRRDAVRETYLRGGGGLLLGHFGTYGALISNLLMELIAPMLERDARRRWLLMGSGSEAFAAKVVQSHPDLVSRVHATGTLERGELAAHLSACDLLIQPYPDGVSTRRGSLIAGMCLGVPTVSPVGALSEPFWWEKKPILVAPEPTGAALLTAAERALADPALRAEAGRKARDFYEQNLDVRHTIAALRA